MARVATFAAIDFETADFPPDSACAVAIVRIERSRLVVSASKLIRPPRRRFIFSDIHGITWDDVEDEPPFAGVWVTLRPLLAGVDFIAAHNARFDQSVLRACCTTSRLRPPPVPFLCTVKVARRILEIVPSSLPRVCRRLRIPLRHHDPASDALACAKIVLAAELRSAEGLESCLLQERFAVCGSLERESVSGAG